MYTNLIRLIENLLNCHQFETVDQILFFIDIEHSGNAFTEYVDVMVTCLPFKDELTELSQYKQRLKSKMINERGEEAVNATLSRYDII